MDKSIRNYIELEVTKNLSSGNYKYHCNARFVYGGEYQKQRLNVKKIK